MAASKPHENKEAAVFLTLVAFVVLALAGLAIIGQLTTLAVLIVILAALLVVYTQGGSLLLQLQEYERAVIFTRGRFLRVAGPGWIFMVPFIQRAVVIDLRTKMHDIPKQDVLTKDNIKLIIDAVLYLKVVDPKAAILNIEDYAGSASNFIRAHLRDVIGKMALDHVVSNIDEINDRLKEELQDVTKEWGLAVDKAEIQSIDLPPSVIDAMHGKKAAEQRRMAATEDAEAKRITIEAVQSAAGKLTDPTLQYLYLQSLQKIAEGKSTKIIFPIELSKLANAISSKLGVPYSEAQERALNEYKELSAEGKKPKTILETMKKEVGAEEPNVPFKKKK